MSHKILERSDDLLVRDVDSGINDAWRWEWMETSIVVNVVIWYRYCMLCPYKRTPPLPGGLTFHIHLLPYSSALSACQEHTMVASETVSD